MLTKTRVLIELRKLQRYHSRESAALVARLGRGDISPSLFLEEFQKLLLIGHATARYYGRVRAGDMDFGREDQDKIFAEEVVRSERDRLEMFFDALTQNKYGDTSNNFKYVRVLRRCLMYLQRYLGSANSGFVSVSVGDKFDWILGMVKQELHCDDCLERARRGPYTAFNLPSPPGMGKTRCMFNCHCILRRRSDGRLSFRYYRIPVPRKI